MKLTKKEKRMGAMSRFKILSLTDYCLAKGIDISDEAKLTYESYRAAKDVELDSLKRSLNAQ